MSDEPHSCRWCRHGSDFGGHRAFIEQLEANLGGLQVRINELENELQWFKNAYSDAIEALGATT
jgi:hypothetical protein